jgi:hypothetical protein
MSKSQLQLLQEFFSSNQQQTLDIRERDEGKVLSVLQTLTIDSTWEDGYKSIQDIRAGVVSIFDENEKEWKGRRVGSALRLLSIRESRISHGLTQYLIKKDKVDNLVDRFHLNLSEPELFTSEINSTISPISTRHAQNHTGRVEKVSKVDQNLATDGSGAGRDGEQGEHDPQTASLPTSTRSTRKIPSIDERFENVPLLHSHVKRGLHPTQAEDWEESSSQSSDEINSSDSEGSNNHPAITNNAVRIDPTLIQDFILKTVVPQEMQRVGYAVEPKITYFARQRFGDAAVPLVPGLLSDLEKVGKLKQAPREGCWIVN